MPRERRVSWRRLLAAGLAAAALAGLAGGALERWRFGVSDAAAAGRVEAMVRREFDAMTSALATAASGIANDPAAIRGLSAAGPDGARVLFDLVAVVRSGSPHPDDIAVTVYDSKGVARAWSGRPSDIPSDRIVGPQDLFVMPSELGLRLVQLQPVTSDGSRRFGAVAVEHVLSRAVAGAAIAPADYSLETPIAPVSLRTRYEGAGDRSRPGAFLLRTPAGATLVEASVSAPDLQRARARWRRTVRATVVAILGVTLVLLIGPLLDARGHSRDSRAFVGGTAAASVLLVAGTATVWLAIVLSTGGGPGVAINLAFCGMGLSAMAALWAAPAVRLRLTLQSRRTPAEAVARFLVMQIGAGLIVAALMVIFVAVLSVAVDPATIDLRHFSMHPWNGPRMLLLIGIVALQVAVLWVAALTLVAARGAWRLPRRSVGVRLAMLALWVAPTVVGAILAATQGWAVPASGLMISATACGVAGLIGSRIVTWFRRATVAARILVLFLAFLVPAVLLYPSLDYFAELATQRLIATRYAVQAQNHSRTLGDKLAQAQREIDAVPRLSELVSGARDRDESAPGIDSATAFRVWSQTVLAQERLTSNVELYDAQGKPVSRFALNLPEYTGSGQPPQAATACEWDVYGENLPIGSEERLVLHAQRSICARHAGDGPPEAAGIVVVHVAFDYRTLPFITSQSPYFEVFRPSQPGTSREGTPGADVEVAIYGWGLQPLYTSGLSGWPITDDLFKRIYDPARLPFWATIPQGNATYQVYFTNDRARIYALGYPMLTLFDHLVHFAEVTTLAGAAFVAVLIGAAVFTRLSRQRPRVGRALLREIRASFYRKLFLAFVLAAIVPVLILALVIRAYVADLLRSDVQAEAARTAAVAQRVIEESDALLRRRAEGGVGPLNDDVMVWISQVINQDVNIFDGPELLATSERDLFSSGLLPTRTPDDVYRAIALDRRPSFVDEDLLGTLPYLIAATPVRADQKDAILTVPLALRQRDIEREIDDLDRGVHLAALFFILLGAAIGLSLAERIADPVRRLTRATQRIAHGDFDARIAVRSVDELRRLVDAFNSMAAELKAQRAQLERTHRLEAWAEMARQVAHEIKNPLTPIQLSAEHLRRVHLDQGQPLGPVLDGCVASILGQVRLLRQIAAEFSSFASSPQAKPSAVDVPELVAEILEPYRAGLAGRIEIQNRAGGPLPSVRVDRTLIARALANIMENALHAMPGRGHLTVDASASVGLVTVLVRDTGGGMDQDALARVFEPYFSTKTTGTGLGLTIARRNIELNGGTIEVGSEKGVGTTVTVRLPVMERTETAEDAERDHRGGAEGTKKHEDDP